MTKMKDEVVRIVGREGDTLHLERTITLPGAISYVTTSVHVLVGGVEVRGISPAPVVNAAWFRRVSLRWYR